MTNQNTDFDFERLAVSAIRVIDSIRSRGRFGNIIPGESRVNAFYRALGLPAVIKPHEDPDEEDTRDLNNAGNLFANEDLPYQNYSSALNNREGLASKKPTAEDEDIFLYFNETKFSGGLDESNMIGIRLPLKPYVVFGDREVFPQNRRVGGAFLSERELIKSGVKYKRPLLETIILMKLKGTGVVNSSSQNATNPGTSGELANLIDLLADNLRASLRAMPEKIADTIESLQQAQTETKQVVRAEPVAEQHPETELRDDEREDLGELDIQEINLELNRAVKESLIGLFEFDDTFGDGANNMTAGLLASEVLLGSATVESDGAGDENSREVDVRKDSSSMKIKAANKTLDLAFGVFSGMSGVDILVIITALVELELNSLLGLLNPEALERLAAIKGKDVTLGAVSVDQALTDLENKVGEIFDELDGQLGEPNYDNQAINQEPES